MNFGLLWATIGLATVALLLVGTIVVKRALADRRGRRDAKLRPEIELQVAEHLALEDPGPARRPQRRAARRLLLVVALEALGELRGAERQRVTELLEQCGVVADLKWRLLSRRWKQRIEAAEALTEVRSERAAGTLDLGLYDRKPVVRLACAGALAELGDQGSIPSVLAVTDREAAEQPGAAVAILLALGRRAPLSLSTALAPGHSPELNRLAAAVIGELHISEHAELLLEALDSPDDELVARAARGLGAIGDVDAVQRLLQLLDEPDRAWFVRLASVGALGQIGDPNAVEAVERELYSDNWYLAEKSATALSQLGAAGQMALDRGLGSHNLVARGHAAVAMQ